MDNYTDDPLERAQQLLDEINEQTDPYIKIETIFRLVTLLTRSITTLTLSNRLLTNIVQNTDHLTANRDVFETMVDERFKIFENYATGEAESRIRNRKTIEDMHRRIVQIQKEISNK